MSFNKVVSVLMIVSQMGWMSFASAAPTATPEFKMLENVLALQGQSLSSDQKEKRLETVVGNYLATAPEAGQQERLQKALVALGIYDENQAAAVIADSQKMTMNASSSADVGSTLATEITQFAQLHPAGAQFSACDIGTVVTGVGLLGFFAGLGLRAYNPTCDQIVAASGTGTPAVNSCGSGSDYPYESQGSKTMKIAGAVTIIGMVVLITSYNCF